MGLWRKPMKSLAMTPGEALGASAADRPGGYATGTRLLGVALWPLVALASLWLVPVFVAILPDAAWLWVALPYGIAVMAGYILCRRAVYMAHKTWRPARIIAAAPRAAITWGAPLTLALIAVCLLTEPLWQVIATYAYTVVLFAVAGAQAGRRERRRYYATELVSAALGLPAGNLDGRVRVRRGGVIIVRPTARAKLAASDAASLDAMLARIDGHEAVVESNGRIVLTPRASYDAHQRRELLAESGGLVTAADYVSSLDTELELQHGISPAKAEAVNAFCRRYLRGDNGSELWTWDPHNRRAVARVVDSRTARASDTRKRIAAQLKTEPWSLGDVVVTENEAEDRINTVTITGAAPLPVERWRGVIETLPGGSTGWGIDISNEANTTTLTWGPPRQIPKIVPGRELLPSKIDPDSWSKLAFGRTEHGTVAELDLRASPHSLVVGPSGSGKSYLTRMLILAALSRGFEVVLIDPSKKAAGLRDMDPWLKYVATRSKDEAAAVLTAVYDEVQRRVALTEEHRVEGWRELPRSLNIRPWFVVVDEYAGLLAEKTAKPFDLKTAEGDAWRAEQEAISTIRGRMAALAAEARSAGIHLCVVTQTAYADLLSGAVRQNLGAIQLVAPKKPTSNSQLGMVFAGDDIEDAAATIAALNDGRSPGFAVASVEGARVTGLRVGLIRNERPDPDDPNPGPEIREDVDYLEELGVPKGIPLVMPDKAPAQARPVFGRRIDEPVPAATGEEYIDVQTDLDLSGAFADFGDLFDGA